MSGAPKALTHHDKGEILSGPMFRLYLVGLDSDLGLYSDVGGGRGP